MATAVGFSSQPNKFETYKCDCGKRYTNQRDLEEHKSNDCKKRSIQCSFCQEYLSSSTALVDHLMLCGNKTDQCPNCQKYIRRAEFAYHYENNCAILEDTDNPTPRSRISSAHRPSSRSASRENHIKKDDNVHDPKTSHRISSSALNKPGGDKWADCPYCDNQCPITDYITHKENCVQNPSNINKQLQRMSLTANKSESRSSINGRRSSHDVVQIPCEFCNEQIDLQSWSTHTQDCRERENRRIKDRAETINREPAIEKLPCEHCEELLSLRELQTHELICPKNPERIARLARIASLTNSQPISTVALSNTSLKTERDPTLSSTYSSLQPSPVSAYNHSNQFKDTADRINKELARDATLQTERFSSRESLAARRTQEMLRLRENDTSSLAINGQRPPKQRKATKDLDLSLVNSSQGVLAYDKLHGLSTGNRLSGTQSLPYRSNRSISLDRKIENPRPMPKRSGSPMVQVPRAQSALKASRDDRGSLRPGSSRANRPLPSNHDIVFHSPRDVDQAHQPIINQRARSTANSNRPPWK